MVDASVTVKDNYMSYALFKFAVSLLFGASTPPRGSIAANQIPENAVPSILQELIIYQYRKWEEPDNTTALFESFKNIVQDKFFNCPVLGFAKAFASSGSGAYVFQLPYIKQKLGSSSWSGTSSYYESKKNLKEVEDTAIQLIFGNQESDDTLVNVIMSAWGNMTKTG